MEQAGSETTESEVVRVSHYHKVFSSIPPSVRRQVTKVSFYLGFADVFCGHHEKQHEGLLLMHGTILDKPDSPPVSQEFFPRLIFFSILFFKNP